MTDDDFIKLLNKLQRKIEYDEEKTYSKIVIHEYRNPNNFGILENPDAKGEIKGPCGDTMKITFKIKDEKIIDARFWTDGCGATIACGSMMIKMIVNKNLKEANKITSSQLLEALGGLPKEHHHCTVLAANTLYESIKDYYNRRKIKSDSM